MTATRARAYRVGFFGILGAGNIGNDAQLESMLAYVRARHPDVVLDAMCQGPDFVRRVYGLDAVPLHWQQKFESGNWDGRSRQGSATRRLPGMRSVAINAAAKGIDAVKTMAWVRRHDVVIVPGAGVMEASLPLRPWEMPYSIFLLGAAGWLFRTKVALVSVGASPIRQRSTRWLFNATARLADYRSYRDMLSLEAMRERGIDTSNDRVYPDLAFAVPVPPYEPGDEKIVAIGVMAYYGGSNDRKRAAELHDHYKTQLKRFIRWLVDGGYTIRLFVGDGHDYAVRQEILDDVRTYRPDLGTDQVTAPQVVTFEDQMRAMASAGTVVASRLHNVISSLLLTKPTISIGYSAKHAAVMAEMGLSGYTQDADSFDADLLIKQFTMAREHAGELTPGISQCCTAKADKLKEQFARLSELLFPAGSRTKAAR